MDKPSSNIVIGWIYGHIDGPRYKVEGFFPDATWYESSWKVSESVRYEQLDAGESFPAGTIWVRKVEDFLWTVEVDGEQKQIFELID